MWYGILSYVLRSPTVCSTPRKNGRNRVQATLHSTPQKRMEIETPKLFLMAPPYTPRTHGIFGAATFRAHYLRSKNRAVTSCPIGWLAGAKAYLVDSFPESLSIDYQSFSGGTGAPRFVGCGTIDILDTSRIGIKGCLVPHPSCKVSGILVLCGVTSRTSHVRSRPPSGCSSTTAVSYISSDVPLLLVE